MAEHPDQSPDRSVDTVTTSGPSQVDLQEDIRTRLGHAEELRKEGNESFRAKRWDEALASYRAALGRLPKLPEALSLSKDNGAEPTADEADNDASDQDVGMQSTPIDTQAEDKHEGVSSETDAECAKARAIINANIGACFMKLEEYKEVVTACTQALQDDPRYVKALQRRATAHEQLGSWSSLSSAQEETLLLDYKQLLEILPASSPDLVNIRRALVALPPRIEAAQKAETAEMLGKLKGLGNSILGNFGLSTDNFQFTPNGQGGYSMNFVR
ncbi:TPR-like protein [Trametes versicolor FP-101664 SS1]|uniref:TPR-like protein n=1 Tax=Trametes versicolor (strain FP-101664) TaxID=717944 RepID=UPI00046221C9|nr:TPR-like protein [Trametes versicolor FP-101664 SS1]EIW64421.1 TPR-like protein [Trametes versicolor FP-101664 SS1]